MPFSKENFSLFLTKELTSFPKALPALVTFTIPILQAKQLKTFDLFAFLENLLKEKSILFLKKEDLTLNFCINAIEIQYNSEIKKIMRNLYCSNYEVFNEFEARIYSEASDKFPDENEQNFDSSDLNKNSKRKNRYSNELLIKSDELFSFENQVNLLNSLEIHII